MTIEEIIQSITELKKLKFDSHSKENYGSYYSAAKEVLHGHRQVLLSPYYSDSFTLFRARKSSSEKVFHNFGEVWYPPIYDVTPGRLNFPYKPIFYCSIYYGTALMELNPRLNDYITMIEVSLDCPELKCVQLVVENIGEETWAKMDPIKREVYKFVIDEIRKPVQDGQFQDYYATQVFAQSMMRQFPKKILMLLLIIVYQPNIKGTILQ